MRWTRILAAKGWGAPHWPQEWGGTGWSPIKQSIFLDETQRGNAPELVAFGVSMVGPVIYTFGSEAQKQRFLPRIIDLSDWWCQGFSEPGAGSDLASLRTSARRDADGWVISGQKTWTTTGPVRRLDFRPRAHQRAGEEAGGHLVLPGRHEDAGDHGEADPDDRRRPRGQRGLSRRRARSRRRDRRRGEQGLGLRQVPARQRAQRHRPRRRLEGASRPGARARLDSRSMAPGRRSRIPSSAPSSPRSKSS